MLAVLSLVIVEKIINTAIASDPITQLNLQALTGKTLRIVIGEPRLKIDVLFNEKRIRFEPVLQKTAIFEPKFEPNAVENRTNNLPNATIFAKNFADLSQQFQQNSLSKYPNIYPNDINPNEKVKTSFWHRLSKYCVNLNLISWVNCNPLWVCRWQVNWLILVD